VFSTSGFLRAFLPFRKVGGNGEIVELKISRQREPAALGKLAGGALGAPVQADQMVFEHHEIAARNAANIKICGSCRVRVQTVHKLMKNYRLERPDFGTPAKTCMCGNTQFF
jgi:hypothetical protein